jgi:oxygen-independent coproporphyrinogen-3 oxidase
MGLRLAEGIDLEAYRRRWKVTPSAALMSELENGGLIAMEGGRLHATRHGRLVLNAVIAQLAGSLTAVD